MNYAEQIIQSMVVELRTTNPGTDMDFFMKPLSKQQTEVLLVYIGEMKEELRNRRKFDQDNVTMAEKLGKALACLETIRDNKFPLTLAKVDLLQEMAGNYLKSIQS